MRNNHRSTLLLTMASLFNCYFLYFSHKTIGTVLGVFIHNFIFDGFGALGSDWRILTPFLISISIQSPKQLFFLLLHLLLLLTGQAIRLFLLQISLQCFLLELQIGLIIIFLFFIVLDVVVQTLEIVVMAKLVAMILLPFQILLLWFILGAHVLLG